jgi:hypothetical protein
LIRLRTRRASLVSPMSLSESIAAFLAVGRLQDQWSAAVLPECRRSQRLTFRAKFSGPGRDPRGTAAPSEPHPTGEGKKLRESMPIFAEMPREPTRVPNLAPSFGRANLGGLGQKFRNGATVAWTDHISLAAASRVKKAIPRYARAYQPDWPFSAEHRARGLAARPLHAVWLARPCGRDVP